ncbi:MAG: thiamine pyrophosphate-dependent enzyme [Symbiobacteriaceae bacterium]|nr:thiamine pyrophosphate-dependent enzyme [Symbiobacteriaceae bacterium]
MNYLQYLKTETFPLFWCGGCGNGVVLGSLVRTFEALGYTKEDTVVVTGIGCWGKADDYLTTNAFHGTHGRALPFATGIKLANDALHVVVLMGDGDGVTIGGNHFIHAARRNIDLTAIVVNNYNYGMTGGQYSATTPENSVTSTSRYGHVEQEFDICRLAEAAGAPFVARTSSDDPLSLQRLMREGMTKKGFALIEVISPCPTNFGRSNGMRTPVEMLQWTKERSISFARAKEMPPAELEGRVIMGKMVDLVREDYYTKYLRVIQSAQAGKEGA